ncbi:hypothetical protein C0J52_23867 [Blattella germanica]|nr:hypothetical protein C0J52_23867 [Blattella germanica]
MMLLNPVTWKYAIAFEALMFGKHIPFHTFFSDLTQTKEWVDESAESFCPYLFFREFLASWKALNDKRPYKVVYEFVQEQDIVVNGNCHFLKFCMQIQVINGLKCCGLFCFSAREMRSCCFTFQRKPNQIKKSSTERATKWTLICVTNHVIHQISLIYEILTTIPTEKNGRKFARQPEVSIATKEEYQKLLMQPENFKQQIREVLHHPYCKDEEWANRFRTSLLFLRASLDRSSRIEQCDHYCCLTLKVYGKMAGKAVNLQNPVLLLHWMAQQNGYLYFLIFTVLSPALTFSWGKERDSYISEWPTLAIILLNSLVLFVRAHFTARKIGNKNQAPFAMLGTQGDIFLLAPITVFLPIELDKGLTFSCSAHIMPGDGKFGTSIERVTSNILILNSSKKTKLYVMGVA